MSQLEKDVIDLHTKGYHTGEIAKKLDMTEYEVVYILEKHHYIRR